MLDLLGTCPEGIRVIMFQQLTSAQIRHTRRRERQRQGRKEPMLKAKVDGHTDLTPFNAICRIRQEHHKMIMGD
jgi:hypothetical protein